MFPVQETATLASSIDLSSANHHPWPAAYSAAVSKLLNVSGIHNLLWGDLLYSWRGSPNIPAVCGLVVPTEQFDAAVALIERSGMPLCKCEKATHWANPKGCYCLPTHFRVPAGGSRYIIEQTLFICPSNLLCNLIPLRPSDPNPLGLVFEYFVVHLYDASQPIPKLSACSYAAPATQTTIQPLPVLTTVSLIKVLIALRAFYPPGKRSGVDYPFDSILWNISADGCNEGPFDLGSSSMQTLWDKAFVARRLDYNQHLWEDVRLEWAEKMAAFTDYQLL